MRKGRDRGETGKIKRSDQNYNIPSDHSQSNLKILKISISARKYCHAQHHHQEGGAQ